MTLTSISLKYFGSTSRWIRKYFADIKDDLQKAGLNYTLDEYLSLALFVTTITFVAETLTLPFIFALLFPPGIAILAGATLAVALSGIVFFLFYSYPTTKAKVRDNRIKKILPFAVSYLATMASSRVEPVYLFKTIGGFKEYGEVAEEANMIVRDVEVFGMTISTAIKNQARRTSSKDFSELLWGMNTIIISGGDLTSYLKQKAESYMNDYRRRIRKYSQDLSLFVEIYLTLIITGSIFFVVLSSIISTVGGGLATIGIQSFVVFILLPVLSVGFIFVIKAISPIEA